MADADLLTARAVIEALGLERHPEGGWFTETFRDPQGGERGHSTAIYYLLEAGEVSRWHRVRDAAEVWHFHAGAPLALSLSVDGEDVVEHVLGTDLAGGERPQLVVPAGCWQSAETMGAFSLVGCTVAPGFSFDAFQLADPSWRPGATTG